MSKWTMQVLGITIGLFIGHVIYSMFSDVSFYQVVERTFFQFGALICYGLMFGDR